MEISQVMETIYHSKST